MGSVDILNNANSFETVEDILSDHNAELNSDNIDKSAKDEFKDHTDTDTSENNLVDVTPVASTEVQKDKNYFTHDAEISLIDATAEENTEVQIIETDLGHDTENNLVDATPVENTEVGIVQNDSVLDAVEQKNEIISDVSFNELMDPYETEGNEDKMPPSKSPVHSISSGPTSPNPELFESTSDVYDNENERVSRKKCLPYFQLPKPNLDEFLVQTDEFLSGNKKDSTSHISLSKEHATCKRKSVLDEFLAKFPVDESPQLQKTHTKCNDTSTRSSISEEYSKVVLCIGQMDELKSPGIKRLALKEFLQKKINEKKSAAFNRSKEITNLDENEEVYDYDEEIDENDEEADENDGEADENDGETDENDGEADENDGIESDVLEEEKIKSGTESSDEDLEEPTVVFSFGENQNNLEDEGRHSDSDESDDDIVTVRKKRKKLQVLEEDDSNDGTCAEVDFVHEDEQKNVENDETDFDYQNGSFSNGPSADTQIKMGFDDIPSYQPVVSFHENMDESSQDSLTSETYKRENLKESLNFAESNLSSQNTSPIPLSMDDPPLMLSGNAPLMGDIFLSQDLAAVCSGAFESREENTDKISLSNEEKHTESKDKIKSLKENTHMKKADFDDEISDGDNGSEQDNLTEEREKIKDFLDLEAELSGEDDGEDDPESDGEGVDDIIAADHEVPSSAEVRDEIVDLHLKQLIDDDEEVLNEFKEKFLDDGELHGDGRTRRFAWKNNAVDIDELKNGMSSESEDETPADSWSSMSQEKAKWREENKEEELDENLNSSYNKNLLKVKIIGKPNFSQTEQYSSRRLSCKRPRGSFLNLDNSSASQVLKKLKASEDVCGGSRTTKHFVFRNDLSEETKVVAKEITTAVASQNTTPTVKISNNGSIFSRI